MTTLQEYLASFINDPLMVDVIMGVLIVVLASGLMRALGIDIFYKK